jgi:hypothetical protein
MNHFLWGRIKQLAGEAFAVSANAAEEAANAVIRAALTGTTDVVGTLWAEHLISKLAGIPSAKLAEGVFAGIVARLGLLTMEQCRPLPLRRMTSQASTGSVKRSSVGSSDSELADTQVRYRSKSRRWCTGYCHA